MKRGLIRWDRAELPPSAFESRLARVRNVLAQRDLPALLVYSDVWRSNQARFLTNFMPYWNRSLVLIPADGAPVLLCGLSPRVYPWIRSVTVFEEVRPAGKLIPAVTQLCTERGWRKLGVLDLLQLPQEVHDPLTRSGLDLADVAADSAIFADEPEIAMRRRAVTMARETLALELTKGEGLSDFKFVGQLERALRLAGAEDLIIHISTGKTAPRSASGAALGGEYSVSLALEYCGHWVRVTRSYATGANLDLLQESFRSAMANPSSASMEHLSGAYPFEYVAANRLVESASLSLQVEMSAGGNRLFYGDTCRVGSQGLELL